MEKRRCTGQVRRNGPSFRTYRADAGSTIYQIPAKKYTVLGSGCNLFFIRTVDVMRENVIHLVV